MINLITLLARGGGGGSSGGGGGAGGIIVLPVIIVTGIIAWWRRKQQIKKAKQELAVAEANDPVWDKAVQRASQVFKQFQQDWSDFDVASMKKYIAPRYFEHISLMMEALQQMKRQNRMSNVSLKSAIIFEVSDKSTNDQDSFDIEMKAIAHDELVDLETKKVLFTDNKPFTEVWNFDRQGNDWMLNKIYQVEAETAIEKGYVNKRTRAAKADQASQMRDFAKSNDFFYNADFGWLLLPTHGELFTKANFGRSDINYHVIGKYHDVLVQFYQYVPVIPDKRNYIDYFKALYKPAYRYEPYIIAQAVLPKSYGDIIVRRRGAFGWFKPTGMTKVSLEGVEFDKDYTVYATDMEKVTSLELLSPRYMERLLELPFEVNIEVVDNILYLFSTDKTADFDTMLALLRSAFQEMKM